MDGQTPKMFWEEDRLETFGENWKTLKGFKYCTPENFAKAGFFSVRTKVSPDAVQCFLCRKVLEGWEKNDDPWQEHKKRKNECLFVKLRWEHPTGDMKLEDILKLYYEMKKNILIEEVEKQETKLRVEMESVVTMAEKNQL